MGDSDLQRTYSGADSGVGTRYAWQGNKKSRIRNGTRLAWTMTGERNLLFTVMGKFFFDRAIGKDFERGLASLKSLAEH